MRFLVAGAFSANLDAMRSTNQTGKVKSKPNKKGQTLKTTL
jgi:hypothetical protein